MLGIVLGNEGVAVKSIAIQPSITDVMSITIQVDHLSDSKSKLYLLCLNFQALLIIWHRIGIKYMFTSDQ